MLRILFLALIGFFPALLMPAQRDERFVSVAFHDVVDFAGDLDDDAVTVDRLIGFFEWLRANRWTAITLDDVEAARLGKKPLPARAILITFDDGYRSLYTRVFPLLLAYRIPARLPRSPACGWMRRWTRRCATATATCRARTFLSWEEAREMARSGFVEFASHSYNLHRGVPR